MHSFKIILKLIRIKHWIKNVFVLIPLLFSFQFVNHDSLKQALVAFFAFCFVNSFVYIINDIIDKKTDANHPKKRNRPIASGKISIHVALIIGLLCLVFADILITYLGDYKIFIIISGYVVMNFLYSWKLKYILFVDVFCIAFGFVLRVYVGAYAIGVDVSNFLFIVILFLSLFLVLGKRKLELIEIAIYGNHSLRKSFGSRYSNINIDKYLAVLTSVIIISYVIYVIELITLSRFGYRLIYSVIFVIYGIFKYLANLDNYNGYGDHIDNLYKDKILIAVCITYVTYIILIAMRVI